jgi:hypothetical protein
MQASNLAKYQFSIFEYNTTTNNSAATKAVLDCSELFTQNGYQNHMLTFNNNSRRGFKFYLTVFAGITKFLLKIRKGALVGVQYPMLNKVFKYFIIAARVKKVRFFCIIHDIESLRLGAKDAAAVKAELNNLNYYHAIIVHNNSMRQWMQQNGTTVPMIPLGIFDYLTDYTPQPSGHPFAKTIVYAGNLGKSKFVNSLNQIANWNFNLYGPNYQEEQQAAGKVNWRGVYSPSQIVEELKGDFGLIWDGDFIDKIDDVLGNYLKFNNPHKFSLYLAAGLPVIAPDTAAIATFIKLHHIGFTVNSLFDLQNIVLSDDEYQLMKNNVHHLQNKISRGGYFLEATKLVEQQLIT